MEFESSLLTPEKIRSDLERYKLDLTNEKILSDYDAFCRDYGFSVTALGRVAVGDGAFRGRLVDGASATVKRIRELYEFMYAHVASKHRENINGIIG